MGNERDRMPQAEGLRDHRQVPSSPHYRKIDVFHYREMRSERDRERLPWFYGVVEDHVHAAISLAIDMSALNRVFHEFDWPKEADKLAMVRNPYIVAMSTILWGLPRNQREIGIIRL
jgi:hypothetical protein